MSRNRRKIPYGEYNRRNQRRIKNGVTLLFMLSVAALGLMALVNRLPIGKSYTYTDAGDLWFVRDGEMEIAAPGSELIILTPAPSPTPTPSPTPAPSLSPWDAPAEAAPVAEVATSDSASEWSTAN